MAVLSKLAILPSPRELKLLSRLQGSVSCVSYAIAPAAGSDFWLVKPHSGPLVRLKGDYQDVEFKFECRFVRVDAASEPEIGKRMVLDRVDLTVRDIALFLVACWVRPARPGEVSRDWEQKVEECGKFDDVPIGALSACVSVGGIVLNDTSGNRTLLAFGSGPPTSLERVEFAPGGDVVQGNMVPVSDIESWRQKLVDWESGE